MKAMFLFILLTLPVNAVSDVFFIPDKIKGDVDFWRRVYAEWDNNQVIFYDSKTKFVYDILNLPKIDNEISSPKFKKIVEGRSKEIVRILNAIRNRELLPPDDQLGKTIHDVLKKHAMLNEKDLVDRLKNQNGLRGQFEYGIRVSGRYADDMKAVLRSQGLPDDLLAMVFVESLFYVSATSHAGASGPWGFVKETAINSGIHVNKFADERLDPIIATWAACRYLNKAKAGLSEWPLIITSYNYGYSGMLRAVTNLGTKDFAAILDNHDSPLFGYASKSYYAEFLAAREVLHNQKKYFPSIEKDAAWKYRTVQVLRPVEATDLFRFEVISQENLMKLNPSLTKHTITGHEVIPPEYVLRVPHGMSHYFYQQIKKIPEQKRTAAGFKISSKYIAKGKNRLFASRNFLAFLVTF